MSFLDQMFFSVLLFSLVIMALVVLVLVASQRLQLQDIIPVKVNETTYEVRAGQKLLFALADHGIHLPAACGGKGSCGKCRVRLVQGGGAPSPIEANHIAPGDAAEGMRLACMVPVNASLVVEIPSAQLTGSEYTCRVVSNRLVSTFLTELKLALPQAQRMDFQAGAYILLTAPPHDVDFSTFDIPEQYVAEWQDCQLRSLKMHNEEPTLRAYSLANSPDEEGLCLVVRIAAPPPSAPQGTPPGIVSSYIFSLKAGDPVQLAGPFGDFFVEDSDREMCFIGGGAGIAPLRSMIRDQLLVRRTSRKVSFWYGARDLQQLCYQEEFEQLANNHENFSYHVVLSEPKAGESWNGSTGFVHAVVRRDFLNGHPSPADIEYYLCGPPLMSGAVITMLDALGVSMERIHYDDFGGAG